MGIQSRALNVHHEIAVAFLSKSVLPDDLLARIRRQALILMATATRALGGDRPRRRTQGHTEPPTHLDALRCICAGSTSIFGLSRDYSVILLATTILVFIGARLYSRLAS